MSPRESGPAILAAKSVEFAYADQAALRAVNLSLGPGDLVGLLGPNGSGKTTLLKVLCGILAPSEGRVEWKGSDLRELKRRETARHIALVPQELNVPFSFSVQEMVELGRTPYVRPLMGSGPDDRRAIDRALELTETTPFANRFIGDLSGGERQRVVIAMALAQEPEVLLLDEPTVHLDINHQVEILDLIRRLNHERGLTVLATMHDLNLASLFFDRLVLLQRGSVSAEGSPTEVLSKERVQDVFQAEVAVLAHPARDGIPHIVLLPPNGNGNGNT